MTTAGIIAEYNPFHRGHRYQIEELRRRTGADYVIIAMSGDFVQRGEPAIVDKYVRTQMALTEGADLVLELPVVYATASAERFARGGVSLLESTGVVDFLGFGAESLTPVNGNSQLLSSEISSHRTQALLPESNLNIGNSQSENSRTDSPQLVLMREIAEVLAKEPMDYRRILRRELTDGSSFPAARSRAVLECLRSIDNRRTSDLMSSPNSILALEYLRVLNEFPRMKPVLIPRSGDDYQQTTPRSGFASASAIRRLLLEGDWQTAANHIPAQACQVLRSHCASAPLLTEDDLSGILGYRLLSLLHSSRLSHQSGEEGGCDDFRQFNKDGECDSLRQSNAGDTSAGLLQLNADDDSTGLRQSNADDTSAGLRQLNESSLVYAKYSDCSPELARRIAQKLPLYQNFSQFCGQLKTKNITHARIRRALLHILLEIGNAVPTSIPYLRVLGFRQQALPLLTAIKKEGHAPLLTKIADAPQILPPEGMALLAKDIYAADLYMQMVRSRIQRNTTNEYTHGIIRVP